MTAVTRSSLTKQYILVLGFAGVTLGTVILFLATQHPANFRTLVPTVSWDRESNNVTLSFFPDSGCAGRDVIRELEGKWGETALRMSLAYGGSGARLRRVLRRFREDHKIVLSVLGGSIAKGHKLKQGDKRWSTLLDEGLKRVYPDSEIEMHNGAVGASGTDYFSACYKHHVPADSDLFILEAAVNDIIIETDERDAVIDNTERLVRQILSSSSDPAVLMLSTWAANCEYINGADRHAVVSEYYDIPRISMRTFLYPYLAQNGDELPKFFSNRTLDHPIQVSHQYMADILLYHILKEDCLTQDAKDPVGSGSELAATLDQFAIPPLRIRQHLDHKPYSDPEPFCSSVSVRLEGDKAQLQPSEQTGWEETSWIGKYYWTATKPGARITFSDINVQGGQLSLFYLRSANLGLGNMRCWADDDEHKAVKLQGYWPYVNIGTTDVVAEDLAPGHHSVTCVTLDEKEDHGEVEGTYRSSIIAVLAV